MKSHVIPALIKRAVQKEDPYIVWGNGYTVRDFVYVDDLVEGILRVLERQCLPDPVNMSNGTPVKIRELVQIILNICDHHVTPQYDSAKPTAVPYRVLDNTKYDTLFGKTKRTSLEDGIRKTVKWYLSPESRE
jgi:GDP-L-fucose synthase